MVNPLETLDLRQNRRRRAEEARARAAERRRERLLEPQPGPLDFTPASNEFTLPGVSDSTEPFNFPSPAEQLAGDKPDDEEKLYGRSIAERLGEIREGDTSGIRNGFLRAIATPVYKLGQGTLAALEWSGNVAEDIAPNVVEPIQRIIPGKQELERVVAEKRAAGRTYEQALTEAWEETNLEAFSIPFWKTAFTPNGSITIDFQDVIQAGFDPIELALTFGTGGLGSGTGLAGIVTGKQTVAAGLRTAVGSSIGVRGAKAAGLRARAMWQGAGNPASLVIPSNLKLLPTQVGPQKEIKVVARIPDLTTLEEQTFRSSAVGDVVERIADNVPLARRIIGFADPTKATGGNPGARSGVLYESVSAMGSNGVEAIKSFVGEDAVRKAFNENIEGFLRADNIAFTPRGAALQRQGRLGLKTHPNGNPVLTMGDVAEFALFDETGRSTAGSLFTGLTADQRSVLERGRLAIKQIVDMIVDEKMGFENIDEALHGKKLPGGGEIAGLGDPKEAFYYMHRKVIRKDYPNAAGDIESLMFDRRRAIDSPRGAASNFTKTRTYQFMEEGAREGRTYAGYIESLEDFAGAAYRMVAEKRALDHLEMSGQLVTSKQVLARFHPGVVEARDLSRKLARAAEARVNELKRQVARRSAKTPLLKEAVEQAETEATRIVKEHGKFVDNYEKLFLKSQAHRAKARTFMQAGKVSSSRQQMAAAYRAEGAMRELEHEGRQAFGRYRKAMTDTVAQGRARRNMIRHDADAFLKTENLVIAEAERQVFNQVAIKMGSRYTRKLSEIMERHDLDARVFGHTTEAGRRVQVQSYRTGPLSGKIAPRNVGEQIEKVFNDRGRESLRKIEQVTGTMRTLSAGSADVGWLTIQGSLLSMTHPVEYAKSALLSLRAVKNPALREKYIRDNISHVIEAVESGVDIGSSEFFQSLDRTGLLGKLVPSLQRRFPTDSDAARAVELWGRHVRPIGRLGTGFNTFLDVAKIELWKSLEVSRASGAVTRRELASHINNLMGTMNSRMLGVSPTQRQIEGGLAFFSPRYTRSAFALVGELFRGPGRAGTLEGLATREAYRAMGGLLAGGTMVMYAIGKSLGQEPELNPFKPGWLTVEIAGQRVGIGGSSRALLDVMFRSTAAVAGLDGRSAADLTKFNIFDPKHRIQNPFLTYWLNRTAPGVREVLLRETYDGEKLDSPAELVTKGLAPRFLPFALQAYANPPQGVERQGVAAFIPESLGLRARPLSAYERLEKKRDEVAQEAYGKNWNGEGGAGLSLDEKAKLRRDDPDLAQLEEAAHAVENQIVGPYFDKIANDRELINGYTEQAAQRMRPESGGNALNGPSFREAYDKIIAQQQLLRDMREDPEGEYAGAIDWLERNKDEREANQTDFDRTYDLYVTEIKDNPSLRDPFGQPLFDVVDDLEQQFAKQVGPEMWQRIRNRYRGWDENGEPLNTDKPPEVYALRAAREVLYEARYWQVPKDIIGDDEDALRIWNEFESLDNPIDRQAFQRRYPALRRYEKKVNRKRLQIRRRSPEVDRALMLWYGHRAYNQENRRLERMLSSQLRRGEAVGAPS